MEREDQHNPTEAKVAKKEPIVRDHRSAKHRVLTYLKWLIPLIVILVLEGALFNAPFWSTVRNNPRTATLSAVSGVEKDKTGWKVTDSNNVFFQVGLPEAHVDLNSVNISPSARGEGNTGSQFSAGRDYSVTFYVHDAANSAEYLPLGTKTVMERLRVTHYVLLHPSGPVSSLRIQINNLENGNRFSLSQVAINPRVPFTFSVLRVALLVFLVYVMMLFAPSRAMYDWRLDLRQNNQRVCLAVFTLTVILVLFGISRLMLPGRSFAPRVTGALNAFIHDDNQADHMANALIHGHSYLDIPAPGWMQKMGNPYDAWARAHMSQKTGQPTYWDYAYYDGRYYSYFGIVPIIAIFVPFKLLTGHDLRTDYAVVFIAALFVCATVFFMYRFLKKYFGRSSFGQYLLYSLFFIISSSVVTQVYYPKIYSLPILTSLVLTMTGLGCWLGAATDRGVKKSRLIIGALLLALNLGARPLFVLSVFLAFPIFWDEIKARLFFSRKGVGNTLSVILPVLFVGVAAMIWNRIRFSSVTDFGATYNLTGFDMVHRAYAWQRIPVGVWLYLLQPLNIQPNFPFIYQIDQPRGFMGQTIMEPYFGGVLVFAPAAIFVIAALAMTKKKYARESRPFVVFSVTLALAIILIDTLVVGVNNRYHGDFVWLICIVAIAGISLIMSECEENQCEAYALIAQKIFYVLVMIGLVVTLWNLVSTERYGALITSDSTLYRMLEAMFIPFS